jgi:hypothetical protein
MTRHERAEESAFLAGLSCIIPHPGVPKLWQCFGQPRRFMCSWCGWSFDVVTGEVWPVRQADGDPIRTCPRCPVEHPELRPAKLPIADDEEAPSTPTGPEHACATLVPSNRSHPPKASTNPASVPTNQRVARQIRRSPCSAPDPAKAATPAQQLDLF